MRGRSTPAYDRIYITGYDMSGYVGEIAETGIEYDEHGYRCLSDAVTGYLPGLPKITFGPINGVFDNTATTGLHAIEDAGKGARQMLMHVRGVQAAPAIGDDTFCAPMILTAYKATHGNGISTVTMTYGGPDASYGLAYDEFYGALLHPWGSETGANSANTNYDDGAETTAGGWLMYQIYSITGSGTVTVSIDDSANGTTWAALSGATSGAIATASAPTAGIVQLSATATVRRYLRWQLALGGSASACTFGLAFMRGR